MYLHSPTGCGKEPMGSEMRVRRNNPWTIQDGRSGTDEIPPKSGLLVMRGNFVCPETPVPRLPETPETPVSRDSCPETPRLVCPETRPETHETPWAAFIDRQR